MSYDPLLRPGPANRLRLKTDQARLTSGRFAAIQVQLDNAERAFVVATDAEVRRGWIPRDDRPVFPGLHQAFDAAHHAAIRERRLATAA
ncbi:MAG: hypothetical protein ACP5VP_02440 [Candidatus Limnocylindrales bacterium]